MSFTIKLKRPASMEIKRSPSLAMVVPELDAATMLVCNIVLMKMIASFSFTSLQHQDASSTTAATKPEFLLTLVRLSKLSVKNLRGELSQQLRRNKNSCILRHYCRGCRLERRV